MYRTDPLSSIDHYTKAGKLVGFLGFMAFNGSFNNISVLSW